MMDRDEVRRACAEAGLRIIGDADERIAEDAVVVHNSLTSPKVLALDESRFRTIPSGPNHTIVLPRVTEPL